MTDGYQRAYDHIFECNFSGDLFDQTECVLFVMKWQSCPEAERKRLLSWVCVNVLQSTFWAKFQYEMLPYE